jgi:hypothetical protein
VLVLIKLHTLMSIAAVEQLEAVVNLALRSHSRFPISIDDVWALLGYSTKGNAVRAFTSLAGLIEGNTHITF